MTCPRDGEQALRLLGLDHAGPEGGPPAGAFGWSHAGHGHWPGTPTHGHPG